MAVTANQNLTFRWLLGVPIESSFLVKEAEEIYTWTAVGLDYSGYLVNWVKDSGYLFVGFALERKTGDISEGVRCRVARVGVIERLPISSGIPTVGTDIYADDNYTFNAAKSATPAAATLTGTVTFTNGSTSVTGSGTAFTTELRPGEKIYFADDSALDAQQIDYITDDTHLTLTSAYSGTGGTGADKGKVLKNADAPIGRVIYKHSNSSADVEFNTIMATNSGLPDDFRINGTNLSLSGTLSVSGNSSLGGTLAVTGASTLTGNASLGGSLNVTGNTTFQDVFNCGADGGSAHDVYTLTLNPALTAYSAGQVFFMYGANADSTGACTLNVNGLGAKNIKVVGGGDPANGAIQTDGAYIFLYDGTNMILLNPSA